MEFDIKKGGKLVAGALGKAAGKAADVGSKVGTAVSEGAKELAEKSRRDSWQRRMKKYNPLFLEEYQSQEFHIPNIVAIVDDAKRRGIDVCEGAIGWREKQNDEEVLVLYDEVVELSGLTFVPAPTCNAVYYVDNFDRTRFIRVDAIFDHAHDERMAELKDIAYSLGAKRYVIELVEEEAQGTSSDRRNSAKGHAEVEGKAGFTTGASGEAEAGFEEKRHIEASNSEASQSGSSSYRRKTVKGSFSGNQKQSKPKLKWFKHSATIDNLIKMSRRGDIRDSYTLEIEGSTTTTMTHTTAKKIDSVVTQMFSAKKEKVGGKVSFGTSVGGEKTLEMRAAKESHSKLIFYVEF